MEIPDWLTYADIQDLAAISPLKVIKDRLGAVRSYFWNEVFSQKEHDFYSVLKRYFDINTKWDLTQNEIDFCEEMIRVMDQTYVWDRNAVGDMIDTLKKRLDTLLDPSKTLV